MNDKITLSDEVMEHELKQELDEVEARLEHKMFQTPAEQGTQDDYWRGKDAERGNDPTSELTAEAHLSRALELVPFWRVQEVLDGTRDWINPGETHGPRPTRLQREAMENVADDGHTGTEIMATLLDRALWELGLEGVASTTDAVGVVVAVSAKNPYGLPSGHYVVTAKHQPFVQEDA